VRCQTEFCLLPPARTDPPREQYFTEAEAAAFGAREWGFGGDSHAFDFAPVMIGYQNCQVGRVAVSRIAGASFVCALYSHVGTRVCSVCSHVYWHRNVSWGGGMLCV
jgi:hypothetical protein